MTKSKILALGTTLACAILFSATPSFAQKLANRSTLSAPTAQQTNTVVRDHRNGDAAGSNASGGVTVTNAPRQPTTCVKVAGGCVTTQDVKDAFVRQPKSNSWRDGAGNWRSSGAGSEQPVRDHRN